MRVFSKSRETGFTLIELLTVIIIIGVLAVIAIPVFSAQRSRAQDSQTISDVRNIVTFAETFLADRTKTPGDITDKSVLDFVSSKNVKWDIKGNNITGGYCIAAFNTSGKAYNSDQKLLTYDSTAGGLKGADGSCGKKDASGNVVAGSIKTGDESKAANQQVSTPGSSTLSSTAVGSLVAYPVLTFNNTSTGASGTRQTFTTDSAGVYEIKVWGAQGGSAGLTVGGSGAYTSGTFTLASNQTLNLTVGQQGESYSYANPTRYVSAGGGGSFVVTSAGTPLLVAGGGGGASSGQSGNSVTGKPGSVTTAGTNGSTSTQGNWVGSNGGTNGGGGGGHCGAGGGGFGGGTGGAGGSQAGSAGNANGTGGYGCSSNNNQGGASYASGSAGGYGFVGSGGFGGGGAAGNYGGGGGGGYSGGGAGYDIDTQGGGGGSYVDASATSPVINNTTLAKTGQGKITIQRIS